MNIKMLEMESFIRASGIRKQEKEMEWEFSFGLMDLNMKDFGEMIKQMEGEE
jgi:hypothetical protein